MLVYLLCLGALILSTYYFLSKNNYWKLRNVPHETSLAIIRNFLTILQGKQNITMLFESLYKKFDAPYFGLSILNKHILVIKDPELIKNILVKDFSKFQNRSIAAYNSADSIAFYTLFFMPNPHWKKLRSKMAPLFSSGKIKTMFPLMINCAEDMMKYCEEHEGKIVDFKEICSKYSTDVITSCAFGINANSFKQDNAEFHVAGKRIFEVNIERTFAQFCYFMMPSLVWLFNIKFIENRAAKFLKQTFLEVIHTRKTLNIVRNDFVDHFNKLKEEGDMLGSLKCDDDLIVAQAIIFFLAGQVSTSTLIAFALYELSIHPNIQNRLRNEINKYENITFDSINEMKFLNMVVQETLRKYPFSPIISREATEDYIFEKTGLKIQKGTSISIPFKPLQYDPQYFPDPEKFDPERFNSQNKLNIIPYTFMPLGEGPRNCIGGIFGLLSSKIALVYLIKHFQIIIPPETEVPIKISLRSNLLAAENGVQLKLAKLEA